VLRRNHRLDRGARAQVQCDALDRRALVHAERDAVVTEVYCRLPGEFVQEQPRAKADEDQSGSARAARNIDKKGICNQFVEDRLAQRHDGAIGIDRALQQEEVDQGAQPRRRGLGIAVPFLETVVAVAERKVEGPISFGHQQSSECLDRRLVHHAAPTVAVLAPIPILRSA
jgi:hypothetical protein